MVDVKGRPLWRGLVLHEQSSPSESSHHNDKQLQDMQSYCLRETNFEETNEIS